MKKSFIIVPWCFMLGLSVSTDPDENSAHPPQKLSEYGFFVGNMTDLQPAARVFSYEVNAPLFSDYAEKARFVYVPEGTTIQVSTTGEMIFPEGSVLIKNFYYPYDFRNPARGRKILETRLLIRESKGWKALEYRWNDTQTDADYMVAGETVPVSWLDKHGKKVRLDYHLPNLNQCKGCHAHDDKLVPLGFTLAQLNRPAPDKQSDNQLFSMQKNQVLQFPETYDPASAPVMPSPFDAQSGTLDARARAYLAANCGHCHQPHGAAATSGLFLHFDETEPSQIGIFKPPVAAGRGSGNRHYSIVPGKPHESILYFRMENNDPGIRMPELGRQLPHQEGLILIKNWIKNMQ